MESNGRVPEEDEKKPGVSHAPSAAPPRRQKHHDKIVKILDACKWKDLDALRALAATEGGLVSDEARRQAWPLLLGNTSQEDVKPGIEEYENWKDLPKHRDEDQVQLDVNRSFIYYPNDQSAKNIDRRKEELSDLITEVLRRQPYLCYFQGYHDICQVFLLVLEPQDRAVAVARLSALRTRDFMLPKLEPALAQLRLIPAILYAANPKLCKYLSHTNPFFALSGTLTMYAHDIEEYGEIARLFDILLAREAVFSVYMFAQIVLQRSDELFEIPVDDLDMLQFTLSKLPKPLNLEALIQNTVGLLNKYPPERLRPWHSISKYSVLKTTRSPYHTVNQNLEFGKACFESQVTELQWAEQREKVYKALWRYRKPVGTISLAVLVGVLSFYVRKSSGFLGVLRRGY